LKKKKQLIKKMENKTVLIWKMAIASALSWVMAKFAGSAHPYLAPLSVILCLQTTINRSIRYSYHRIAGTVIGIIVVVLLEPFFHINGWTLGALILIGCFLAKWLQQDESAIHQTALTVMLVFVLGHKSGEYPIDRFRDTLIGAIIAVLIQMLVHPPNYVKFALDNCQELTAALFNSFSQTAEWIDSGLGKQQGDKMKQQLQKLEKELQSTKEVLNAAKESLAYNPFASKSRKELQKCNTLTFYCTEGISYLFNAIETLMTWSENEKLTEKDQINWAAQIKALTPLFGAEEMPLGHVLSVNIPEQMEPFQYPLSLYLETRLFVKKLSKS